jgi:hypothetical protein
MFIAKLLIAGENPAATNPVWESETRTGLADNFVVVIHRQRHPEQGRTPDAVFHPFSEEPP